MLQRWKMKNLIKDLKNDKLKVFHIKLMQILQYLRKQDGRCTKISEDKANVYANYLARENQEIPHKLILLMDKMICMHKSSNKQSSKIRGAAFMF